MAFSLWKNEKLGLDFQYFDRTVLEQFRVGGVDMYVHEFLGASTSNVATTDATQPKYPNQSAQNIGDLLFQATPNRSYNPDILRLRCHYEASDLELDLTQFGLMLANGTLFITVHLKNMVDTIGRKLMAGDVLELPNMKDFYALDSTIPVALKRFYVVQDGSRPAVGYSPSWWNHLWRLRCTPLVNSQEYQSILGQPVVDSTGNTIVVNGNTLTYANTNSSLNYYLNINDAVLAEAGNNLPKSGYDTTPLWSPLFVNGDPSQGPLPVGSSPEQKWTGWLVGDNTVLDGYPLSGSGLEFPSEPNVGDYFLRLDFFPNRMYRWTGSMWQFVEMDRRSPMMPGDGLTEADLFVNNSNTFINQSNVMTNVLQTISQVLDNG